MNRTLMARSRTKGERRSVREESRAVYRRAILEAAVRVFGQTGFSEAKIADIAAEAGVATGTLYNYFSSKEEIFQSILADGREKLGGLLEERAEIDDPIVRLRELLDVMFESLEQGGAVLLIYLQIGGSPLDMERPGFEEDETFRRRMMELFTTAIAEADDRVRADMPPEILAHALGGLINGFMTRWISAGCGPGLREHTDTIMDLFLKGASTR